VIAAALRRRGRLHAAERKAIVELLGRGDHAHVERLGELRQPIADLPGTDDPRNGPMERASC
jgi:hypothetical protein